MNLSILAGLVLAGLGSAQTQVLPTTASPSVVVVVTTQTSLTTVRVRPTTDISLFEPPTDVTPILPLPIIFPTQSVVEQQAPLQPPILEPLQPPVPEQPTSIQPSIPTELPASMQPLPDRPANMSSPLSIVFNKFLGSRNYSSVFHHRSTLNRNASNEMLERVCELSEFCQQRPPGLYCYSKSIQKASSSGSMQAAKDCLPVAMIACPEAVFIGCAEGFACHQVPDVWPWDIPPSQRALLYDPARMFGGGVQDSGSLYPPYLAPAVGIGSSTGYAFQDMMNQTYLNQTSPLNQTTPLNQNAPLNETAAEFPMAHCMAVYYTDQDAQLTQKMAMMPQTREDWGQWCSYYKQLKAAAPPTLTCISGKIVEAPMVTSSAKFGQTSPATATMSMETVWWWPGMETGAPPHIPTPTASSVSTDSCIPTPPPTCKGPYPYAQRQTKTYLFISVSTTTAATATSTILSTIFPSTEISTLTSVSTFTQLPQTVTESAAVSFVTQLATITQVSTRIQPETVFVTQTVPAPILAETGVAPPAEVAPIAPPPVAPVATPTAPTPVVAPSTSPVAAPIGTPIPAEAFPKAGEPFEVYTAKIGAIATIA